jgi:hypothetical protein
MTVLVPPNETSFFGLSGVSGREYTGSETGRGGVSRPR